MVTILFTTASSNLFTWLLHFRVDSGLTRTRFLIYIWPTDLLNLLSPALVMVTIPPTTYTLDMFTWASLLLVTASSSVTMFLADLDSLS